MTTSFETEGILAHIASLSSAEEIFTYLLLPFDQKVLDVSRLHIMKRMGQYLKDADLSGHDEDEIFLAARQHLKRAYLDFVELTPLREKVFKVFTDRAEAPRLVNIDSGGLLAG